MPTAYTTFIHSERSIVIGAHEATVQPDFSQYARIDFGPVLPQVRLPAEAPLGIGVNIRLGDSDVSDLNQLVARDAVIASQPEGEIAAVRTQVNSMAMDAILRGIGAALLALLIAIFGWKAIGQQRRRALWAMARHPDRRQKIGAVAVAVATIGALALVAAPERPRSEDSKWLPIGTVFPEIPADPVLDRVEIAEGGTTSGSKAVVEGALTTYRASVEFYGKLEKKAESAIVRTPLEGEMTALVVTDRHDNIGMDPVARAIADQAQAKMLIDLGDDTSSGAPWETFSLNSLAREFKGFDIVSVAGNHDTGSTVRKQMTEKGFTVLDGKPIMVNGIRFLGESDPRSSGLTRGYTGNEADNIAAIRDQDAKLRRVACDDGEVNVIAVHAPTSATEAAKSGCADLVLSGHLHLQVGPTLLTGLNGRSTVTLTTGTTGGAFYSLALGIKLRRDAQVTVVTFEAGVPVGLQPVTFDQAGNIKVAEYIPINVSPRNSG